MQSPSNEEHYESIPLDDKVEIHQKDERKGYFFSRRKIAVVVAVVIVLFIAVIVLAVLVGEFDTKRKGIQLNLLIAENYRSFLLLF